MTDTPNAAKLLPCPDISDARLQVALATAAGYITACRSIPPEHFEDTATLLSHALLVVWNTRPQPAPPAGEPQYHKSFDQFRAAAPYWTERDAAALFGGEMYRLGLAARLKVEDAEVVSALAKLRDELTPITRESCRYLADLLERLAGENERAWRENEVAALADQKMLNEFQRQRAANAELIITYRDIFAEITAKAAPLTNDGDRITSYAIPCGPIHRAAGKLGFQMFDGEKHMQEVLAKLVEERQRAETAESKLAEREAELAKADAVIYENMIGMRVSEDFTAACTRHAARQQQKASAEPTESKAGEAR